MLKLTEATSGQPMVIAPAHFVAAYQEQTSSGRRVTHVYTTSHQFMVQESLEEISRQPAWG